MELYKIIVHFYCRTEKLACLLKIQQGKLIKEMKTRGQSLIRSVYIGIGNLFIPLFEEVSIGSNRIL